MGLVVAVAICEIAGGVGAIFVAPNITGWYSTLVKPALNPPAFIFGPVWTLLYLLMGIAVFIVWKKGFERADVRGAIKIFIAQLFLNTIWSPIFFGMRNIGLGLFDITALWVAIVATIVAFWKVSKSATWLLRPIFTLGEFRFVFEPHDLEAQLTQTISPICSHH